MTSSGPDKHIAAARARLSHLGGIAARTEEAERRILDAAEERMGIVSQELAQLGPRVNLDAAAANRYQALTLERGRLGVVAAQSRQVLGPGTPLMAKALPKSRPRSLYVMRPVQNADAILAWARDAGIPNLMPADEMHVTVAYSRRPVDWSAFGHALPFAMAPAETRVDREVKPLGGEGAVVLRFKCQALAIRWQEFRDAGASWDYPGYQPHVTLTYDAKGADLSAIAPYAGPIELGPEQFAEVDDGWAERPK